MKKDLEFLTKRLIAHRGMHSKKLNIPENSIKAFKRAIDYKFPIELDLHLLKDKKVVVFHDDNLKRMTGVDKDLKDVSYDEIKDLKLKGTDNYIPLFTNVLNLVNGKVPLLIELKIDNKVGLLEEEFLKIIKSYKGDYAVQSFNPNCLYFINKKNSKIKIGILISNAKDEKDKNLKYKRLLLKPFINYDFLSLDIKDLKNKENKSKRNKLVLGWTIKNKKELENNKDYYDNFICNNLDELIEK